MQPATTTASYAALLRDAEAVLTAAGVATPRLDAEVLVAAARGGDRAALYARLHDEAPESVARRCGDLVTRRAGREPVAYLTGVQEFWSLPFAVTPDVLIPRPETELLVETVCALTGAPGAGMSICDIGTGSGCIAVALARELPAAQLCATDRAPAALAVARQNAVRHGVAQHIAFACGDLFADLDAAQSFDVVVSNPPYVADDAALPPEVCREPRGALFAGPDGLAVVRRLLAAAPARLRPGGRLVIEIGGGQAEAVRQLAAAHFDRVQVLPDLAGIPRAVVLSAARAQPGAARIRGAGRDG